MMSRRVNEEMRPRNHTKIQDIQDKPKNTGKYRTARKIQEFTGFTGPLGTLNPAVHVVLITIFIGSNASLSAQKAVS